MKKIHNKSQLIELNKYPLEVVNNVTEIIEILDINYGVNRNVNDLGGYIFIAENTVDIEVLKEDTLKDLTPEYMDIIVTNIGIDYISSLYLLSSDYSIVVIATEEISKILLE